MSVSGFDSLSSAIDEAENYTRWIIERFSPYFGERVVEVGLGHANYRPYLPGLKQYLGVDIDAGVIEAARQRHPSDRFERMDICDPNFPQAAGAINPDTLICFNVLQYLEDDRLGIANMMAPLSAGGHLCLLLPGIKGIFGTMDRLAGHLRRYSRRSALEILDPDAGDPVVLDFFNPVGGLGWWVNNFRRHESLEDESISSQIRLFDKYAIPVSRMLDPLTRPFFGQSLAFVIRKK